MIVFSVISFADGQKIAYIYSAFNNYQYKDRFGFNQGDVNGENYKVFNWDRYENTDIKSLLSNINNYDMVILGATGNYVNTVDFSLYAKEWQNYVNNGGVIFVTDANYDNSTDWIGKTFPGYDIIFGEFYKVDGLIEDGRVAEKFAIHHPMLKGLKGELCPKTGWGRIKTVSPNYNWLYKDEKGKCATAYKEFGKGMLMVAAYSSDFYAPTVKQLNNIFDYIALRNFPTPQVKVNSLKIGKTPVENNMSTVYGSGECETKWSVNTDGKGLHFNFVCHDTDRQNSAKSDITTRDGDVYEDDCVEIFINVPTMIPPIGGQNSEGIFRGINLYHFAVNYANTQFDEKNFDKSYDTYFESKVTDKGNDWICDVYIPFSSIEITTNTKLAEIPFTVNVGRNYHPGLKDESLESFAPCPDYILYNSEYFSEASIDTPLQLSSVTKPISLNVSEKLSFGNNKISIDTKENITIIDYTTRKNYKGQKGVATANFTVEGEHILQGVIFDKNGVCLASTPLTKVVVEDVISCDLIYPAYRNIVQSKDPNKTLKINCKLNYDKIVKLNWTVSPLIGGLRGFSEEKSRGGVVLQDFSKSETIKPNEKKLISYDLSTLPVGNYSIKLNVSSGKQVISEKIFDFEVLPPADYEVTFDEKHICYVNGEPFFPLMLYHCHPFEMNFHKKEGVPEIQLEDTIKDIKAHGFNYAHIIGEQPDETRMKPYLDLGMPVTMEPREYSEDYMKRYVDMFNKTNMGLYYYTVDEPMGERLYLCQPAYDTYRKYDPHRPVIGAVNVAANLEKVKDAYDVIMVDPYVIRKDEHPGFNGAFLTYVRMSKNVTNNKKPIWVVPQAFGWGYKDAQFSIPTPEEVVCQGWLSIVEGATGLFWYAYATGEKDETARYNQWYIGDSDIWDVFPKLNKEITEFFPYMVKGNAQGEMICDNGKIRSNVWKVGEKYYAIIVNPETTSETATFKFKSAKPMFEDKYNIDGSKISFKPFECVIAEIEY